MDYFLKEEEESVLSVVIVRPDNEKMGFSSSCKIMALVKELTVATDFSKIVTVHNKICNFYVRLE